MGKVDGSSGISSSTGYWTERTFTLNLENHEAQLLWEQVETGKLAISFGYTFYADVLTGGIGEIDASGKKDFVREMEASSSDILGMDTITSTQVIKSNAFPIRVDVNQWPDVLKKIDLNEEVPPAYAALEVKCFDFADDLRPDLALKSIEIHATGVGGSTVRLPSKKFLRTHPDLNTIQVRFPYAVKMNKPLRYKVTEYTLEGTKKEYEWVTRDSWTGIIDITTPMDKNLISKEEIEIEANPTEWETDSIQKVEFVVHYSLNGNVKQLSDEIEYGDPLPIKTLSFKRDLAENINLHVNWYLGNGTNIENQILDFNDEYLFLDPPEF